MTANELLEESLKKLAAALTGVPAENLPEIQNIREAITAFDGQKLDPDTFAKRIKELAEAIIHTRAQASTTLLKTLPVPPYDLWLPFKAQSLRDSDSLNIPGAYLLINQVLGGLFEKEDRKTPGQDPEKRKTDDPSASEAQA